MSVRTVLHVCLAAGTILVVGCSKSTQPASSAQPAAEAPKQAHPATTQDVAEPTQAVVGEVEEVGPQGSHIVVRTSDGKQHRVETHSRTQVKEVHHDSEKAGTVAAVNAYDAIRKGTKVAVHFTEESGKFVAHQVRHAAQATWKESEVVIDKVEDAGRKVAVTTKDGVKEVYDVSKEATVTAGRKITDVGKVSAATLVAGTKTTIHFTTNAGSKMVHFFEHKHH